ncbi:galactose mutarotase [Streptomyces alfalfae]|uniref:Aldose 1-epimerase n=2 Tax=Streptomyces alfalfae TaxID=1642299 RepID=A0A1P8TLL0_9ACTN|nr:aldose epimerase family protein [Streptomyces alfalfae]AYA18910.1 galactose mutarotase [Streptomyces fradiae]APY88495.1 galactose mutarotase [Streptomyces alfalfae]QQC89116.1 galactose mutarotase [Streptomyces alfalfae]QUI31569.1 galactose mutarotase [Streptomyces alfalfae]RXX47595.1 galactose mutarotase [Streptomyces alfalfae]
MRSELFGALPDGTPVHRWTLERGGVRVRVLTYGGILQSAEVPDRSGRPAQVALGFEGLDGYVKHPGPYFGAVVGRYANRVAGGAFTLDGHTHRLARNNGANALHGGERGFDKRVWDAEPDGDHAVRLARVSPDGEEGYPGRLAVSVTYALDGTGALSVAYEATTDAPTVVNLTNHTYWNLAGAGSGGAHGHEVRIAASRITPVDAELIPTGVYEDVAGTRFDFRTARTAGPGFDHNFVLDKGVTAEPVEVAGLHDPATGRNLTVSTTEPGLQLYTADHFDAELPFAPGDGIALETQHFPDSPNRPGFPSTVLRPGETYRSRTVYGFSVR